MTTQAPWLAFYKDVPADMVTPDMTLYEMLAQSTARSPDSTAMYYLGRRMSYSDLKNEVDQAAAAFTAHGIRSRDSVILSLPNVPAVVIGFYALNKIGAYAVMTHPLSSIDELEHYISVTNARWAVTVDMFYPVFAQLAAQTGLEKVVLARIPEYASTVMKVGFRVTKGQKIPAVPVNSLVIWWKDFLADGAAAPRDSGPYCRPIEPDDGCVILFSGGTTDLPKAIELTSANFNSQAVSIEAISHLTSGDSVLAILPAFHGFGLGLTIHAALCVGAHFILVPEFSPDIYIANLNRYTPSYIAGVPTLFQALLTHPKFQKVRFGKLKGAYSGGDMLSADLKKRFDEVIMAQGSTVELMEGYGLTECVSACAISPAHAYREDSMGIPMPGVLIKVVDSTTGEELPYGEQGEFCVHGALVMKGYLQDPGATAHALRVHADGRTWLHTGDIGSMDPDGYLYFMGRMKRIIKVSGVAVFPMQVEQILEAHPLVNRACVIGIPNEHQMSSVKAFITLADGSHGNDDVRLELTAHCKHHLIKWAVPRHIEFRTHLPTTRVGKIAYTELEREEAAKATY